MKTKILCLMLVIFASVSVLYAQRVKVGDLYYSLNANNQTAKVVKEGNNSNYAGLSNVNIPPSITYNNIKYHVNQIDEKAFYGRALESITIPSSIDTIREDAFSGVSKVYISDLAAWCSIQFGYINDGLKAAYTNANPLRCGGHLYLNNVEVIDLVIPNGVTRIENAAFAFGKQFKSVTIPSSVTYIGYMAFNCCDSLKTVYISDLSAWCNIYFDNQLVRSANPLIYAHRLFLNNVEVIDLVIPNNISTIGSYVFLDCSNIKTIYIPNSVTKMGYQCFAGTSPSSITMESSTPIEIHTNSGFESADSIIVPCGSLENYQQAEVWSNYASRITYVPYPSYTITKQAINGSIYTTNTKFTMCDTPLVICTAKPDRGYYFTQWSDGNIDNPRSFLLTQDTTFEAQFAMNYSGQCGDSLYWRYSKGTLTITGTGDMYDTEVAPWELFRDSITSVILPKGLTSIGYGGAFEKCKSLVSIDIPSSVTKINSYAFYNCEKLNSVTLPISLTSLGYSAFGGCRDLLDVYCLAPIPPLADASSFTNYNVYLHVPCDNLKKYQTDAVFGSFKYINCIGAEETSATDISIVAGETSATFTWPIESTAETYNLEIKKDGVVFCTLTFNATGQLTSIAFAPARGIQQSTEAIATATGYRFTVTGLDAASWYSYDFDVKNSSQQSVKNYKGNFATNGATALKETSFPSGEDRGEASKVIINGILYLLRDGQYFTAQGERVEL